GQHRQSQRRQGGYGRSAAPCQDSQAPFHGAQVVGQAIQRFHAASLSTERCRFPNRLSATASANTASITYHHRERGFWFSAAVPSPVAFPLAVFCHSPRVSGGAGVKSDSRRSEFTATNSLRPLGRRIS